MMRYLFCN